MMKVFLLLFLISSCSFFKTQKINFVGDYKSSEDVDFLDQLESKGEQYHQTMGRKVRRIKRVNSRYLKRIYTNLVNQNQNILTLKLIPTFYKVKDQRPFFFSLPNGSFYFSTGLIRKYIKTEAILITMLVPEIFKVHRKLYRKKESIPIGVVQTEDLISYGRLPLKLKNEVNKWSYNIINKSGYDSYAYLLWLQLQNKNTLDFMFLHGDSTTISREEFDFKSFIATKGGLNQAESSEQRGSSDGFYKLLDEFRENNGR